MDSKIYQQMVVLEKEHWWFVARRSILDQVIRKLNLPQDSDIFEAGCGTGGNLEMLSPHGRVYAMELDDEARSFASKREVGYIQAGYLPHVIPFEEKRFDLIVILDVLEHLEKDLDSLKALYKRLKKDGWLLITVPAYPWLWTRQDDLLHHKRRYVLPHLYDLVHSAGYQVHFVSYFNSVLFPLIAGVRLLQRLTYKGGNDLTMPSKLINQLLTSLFSVERYVIGRLSIPFGVSLLLIAQRN